MEKMNITGAIFDVDGTLINSLIFWEDFYKRLARDYFPGQDFRIDTELDRKFRTSPEDKVAALLHEAYGIGKDAEEILRYFKDLCYLYYREIVELKDGVRELLAALKEKGVRMCIASASEVDYINISLTRLGVRDYFDGIICCSEVGASKEKPDVFLAAEKFLGTDHESTWIFEDSLTAVKTAKAAGFKVAGIFDENAPGAAEIESYADEFIGRGGSFKSLIPKL